MRHWRIGTGIQWAILRMGSDFTIRKGKLAEPCEAGAETMQVQTETGDEIEVEVPYPDDLHKSPKGHLCRYYADGDRWSLLDLACPKAKKEEEERMHGIYGRIGCCHGKTCYPFVVSLSDALARVGSSTSNYRTDDEIMDALKKKGRPVFQLSQEKYSIRYKSGYFVMGCGRINCVHYHGYFVTSFDKLPGIVGGWGNSCCTGPDGYGYGYSQAETLRMLEELKNAAPVIHTVKKDGFLFQTGYYPWWNQNYVGGAMTFELCVISGHVTLLEPTE